MTYIIGGGGLPANNYATVTIEKHDLNKVIAALGVRVYGTLLKDVALEPAWALVREIYAEGNGDMVAQMKLTASDPPASQDEIYNAAAYNKIFDTNIGCPNVITDDAGECSDIEAKQYARKLLQNALRLASRRQYTVTAGLPDTLPEKGDTVQMPDGFKGVLLGYTYAIENNAESLTLDIVDFNTAGY